MTCITGDAISALRNDGALAKPSATFAGRTQEFVEEDDARSVLINFLWTLGMVCHEV